MKSDYFHSVVLEHNKCIGCTYCLRICPTEAIRLRNGKANIIAERCIDCGECIRICPNHAKNTVTDSLEMFKEFNYTAAIVNPVLYSQFNYDITPLKVMSAIKSLGFDDVFDSSIGSEIVSIVAKKVIQDYKTKPVINSSCPAILRLIQVRFPELLDNVLNIDTPAEITARLAKMKIAGMTGISPENIGIVLISPCTARVTSVKNPLGIDCSFMDGVISLKDIYGSILRAIPHGSSTLKTYDWMPTQTGMAWGASGGQAASLGYEHTLAVSGINNAISVLEEIEMGRMNKLSFIEISACPEGCVGGPLAIENKYVALYNIKNAVKNVPPYLPSIEETRNYFDMYDSGLIKFTKKIEPKMVENLDHDIRLSIGKMDTIKRIVNTLPGINCGICGSPTCQAFAEDIVMGSSTDNVCPVSLMQGYKKDK